MLYILLIVIVALLAWVIVKPTWMPAPPKNAVTDQVARRADQVARRADQVGQTSAGWFARVQARWKKPASLGAQLKSWATGESIPASAGFTLSQSADLAQFRAWVITLSDAEADLLARELDDFCQKQGVNIRWLLDDQGNGDMQSMLAALVLFYGLAVRERVNALPAAALREWEQSPLSRRNRLFGTHLFTCLFEAELVSIPAHLLFAPEKERLVHMISAIKSAIVSDREAVLLHTAQVLEEQRAPKQPKTKATPVTVE